MMIEQGLSSQREQSMNNLNSRILIGRGKQMHAIPATTWHKHLDAARSHAPGQLSFMTDGHHRVRNFVVEELPRNAGKPLRAEDISQRLDLPLDRVVVLLAELQQKLFFLVLNDAGAVSWAFR